MFRHLNYLYSKNQFRENFTALFLKSRETCSKFKEFRNWGPNPNSHKDNDSQIIQL